MARQPGAAAEAALRCQVPAGAGLCERRASHCQGRGPRPAL